MVIQIHWEPSRIAQSALTRICADRILANNRTANDFIAGSCRLRWMDECPLLRVRRTWRMQCEMSANDPKIESKMFQFPPHTIAAVSTRNRSLRSSERFQFMARGRNE